MNIHAAELVNSDQAGKLIKKENKAVLLETSPKCPLFDPQKSAKVFCDEDFPANLQSLTGEWGFMEKYKNVSWAKATQALPNCRIFAAKISPKDIIQGKLGNCYFLAALAALVERPDRIFNLFLTP